MNQVRKKISALMIVLLFVTSVHVPSAYAYDDEYFYVHGDNFCCSLEYGEQRELRIQIEDSNYNEIKDTSGFEIQWFYEDEVIPNANSTSYRIDTTQLGVAGNYKAVVTRGGYSDYWNYRVDVNTNLTYIGEDEEHIKELGSDVTFEVEASSMLGNLTYKWEKSVMKLGTLHYDDDNAEVLSNTTSTLTLENITKSDYAKYTCTISDGINMKSKVFLLNAECKLSASIKGGRTKIVGLGQSLDIEVEAYSDTKLTYKWEKRQETLEGVTGSKLSISKTDKDSYANYVCIVSDEYHSKYLSVEVVTFDLYSSSEYELDEAFYHKSYDAFVGDSVTMELAEIKKAPGVDLNFTWYSNCDWEGNDSEREVIKGATTDTYTLPSVQIKPGRNSLEFIVDVTDGVMTRPVRFFVHPIEYVGFWTEENWFGPTRMDEVSVVRGAEFSFSLIPNVKPGYEPTYQWFMQEEKDFVNDEESARLISGQTSPTLKLPAVTSAYINKRLYCIATVTVGKEVIKKESGTLILRNDPSDDSTEEVMYEHRVSFDSAGGTDVETQIVIEGNAAVRPEDPQRPGYMFKGWQLDNKAYEFNQTVDRDITLHAVWENRLTKITATKQKIAYYMGEKLTIDDLVVSAHYSDNTVKEVKAYTTNVGEIDMSKPGTKYLEICYEENGVMRDFFLRIVILELPIYTVTFKSDNTIITEERVKKGESVIAPKITKGNYLFAGWDKPLTNITANTVINAKWKQVSVGKGYLTSATNISTKQMKVTYNALSGISGYQVRYSTNSNMSSATVVTLGNVTSTTIKDLKLNATYYVQVRGFAKDSTNTNVYGAWSDARKVIVNK